MQAQPDGRAKAAQTKNNDLVAAGRMRPRFGRFTRRGLAFKDAQQRLEQRIKLMRVSDHVGRGCDGHEAHHGHKTQRVFGHMPDRDAHGNEDQRKLADLRHGQPSQKTGALAVAHRPHDRQHDQRVADQHEQRQDDGPGHMGSQKRQVQRGPQRDEEKQQQKIAQGCQPGGDGLAVGGRGQRHTRHQAAHLFAQADKIADGGKHRGQGDGEDHQKFGRAGQPFGQRIGNVAHEDDHRRHQRQPGGQHHQHRPAAMPAAPNTNADGRQHDHGQHDHQVLHDQKPQRNLAMQGVDLALVGQELDDDDGRRKRQRDRHVKAGDVAKPQRQADQIAEKRCENDLPEPGHHRDHAQRPDQLHVQLDADQKQQHRNAEFGQQLNLRVRTHNIQRRWPRDQADGDEADDQRLARQRADKADGSGHDQQQGHFGKGGQIGHWASPPSTWPFRSGHGIVGAVRH